MPLFKVNASKLEQIEKSPFERERDMQTITENNLEIIFNLEFVCTEFQLNNLRIDTLGYDSESKAFVIIEYKKERNFSVIDQGYAYLALLLNNKADFILEYNEKMNKSLKRTDVDWSQSRVLFIAPNFTTHQKGAIEFKDLPMELWEMSRYTNNTVLFDQLKSPDTNESINTISNANSEIKKVSKEVKVYTEKEPLRGASKLTNDFYFELKEKILSLDDDIETHITKNYIAFRNKNNKKNFVYFAIGKSYIDIVLNLKLGELEDPYKITDDVSKIGKWGNGDYRIKMKKNSKIDEVMYLIKQAYNKN